MLKRAFGPEHEIDDLVQEVFLTLFKRVHTLRQPQALRAFLIAITAHTIRYELRRQGGPSLASVRGARSEAQATDVDLDSREAIARLYRILDRLGSDDRTAFVLRFMEGLELTEVSSALGVSLATAKRRLARAWRRVAVGARRDGALAEYLGGLGRGAGPMNLLRRTLGPDEATERLVRLAREAPAEHLTRARGGGTAPAGASATARRPGLEPGARLGELGR